MKDHDLDALFLTRPINMYYTCGLQNTPAQHTIGWPYGLIVKRDGAMNLVLRSGMGDVARASSYAHSITEYRKRGDFAETMRAAFAKAGLKGANVGAELGAVQLVQFSTGVFIELVKSAGVKFADGGPAIWDVRMVKSPEEIERMRVAGETASRAGEKAFSELKAGMTEREFARLIARYVIEEGAERTGRVYTIIAGEMIRGKLYALFPTDKKLERNTFVCADFGGVYRHYWSDLHRVGFIGSRPPQHEKEHFDLYMEANRKGVEAIRPGNTMDDAYQASVKVFEEAGLGYPFIRTGHGLGLEGQELPDLMKDNTEKIRPGMVFAIEPFAVPSKAGVIFNCEDNVACTETGPDLLSTPQKEIWLA